MLHNVGKKQIHLYQTEFYCRQPVREQNTIDQLVHLLANAMNKELVFGEDQSTVWKLCSEFGVVLRGPLLKCEDIRIEFFGQCNISDRVASVKEIKHGRENRSEWV